MVANELRRQSFTSNKEFIHAKLGYELWEIITYPEGCPTKPHLWIITSFELEIFAHSVLINSTPFIRVKVVPVAAEERNEFEAYNDNQPDNQEDISMVLWRKIIYWYSYCKPNPHRRWWYIYIWFIQNIVTFLAPIGNDDDKYYSYLPCHTPSNGQMIAQRFRHNIWRKLGYYYCFTISNTLIN